MSWFTDLFRQTLEEPVVQQATPRVRQPASGNGLLLERTGLRVVHLRNINGRDMTVAYRPRPETSHNLEIATAVRNPVDVFSRKTGTRQAIENFINGERLRVPGISGISDVQTIKVMFELPQRAAEAWFGA